MDSSSGLGLRVRAGFFGDGGEGYDSRRLRSWLLVMVILVVAEVQG